MLKLLWARASLSLFMVVMVALLVVPYASYGH